MSLIAAENKPFDAADFRAKEVRDHAGEANDAESERKVNWVLFTCKSLAFAPQPTIRWLAGMLSLPEKQRTPTRRTFRQLGNFLSSQVGFPNEGLINVAVDSLQQMLVKRGHQNLGFWTVL